MFSQFDAQRTSRSHSKDQMDQAGKGGRKLGHVVRAMTSFKNHVIKKSRELTEIVLHFQGGKCMRKF